MAYSEALAERVRNYLAKTPDITVEEKPMFGGLAFLVNDKMCVNVSQDRLMCRFDPAQTEELSGKTGFLPMVMKGREFRGYCYVEESGYESSQDFAFWLNLCLGFNSQAKSSKKR